jgi:spore maturation protein CgeB
MRVLYVGLLWEGSTSLERMRILERLGCTAIPFDTTPFEHWKTRIERSLAHRAKIGRPLGAVNRALRAFAADYEFDAVWVDKGVWIYPETLRVLKQHAERSLAVHYTPDAQILQHQSRHFLRSLPLYDLAVTTKPFETQLYRDHGATDVLLVLQGYGRQFFPASPPGTICGASVPTSHSSAIASRTMRNG